MAGSTPSSCRGACLDRSRCQDRPRQGDGHRGRHHPDGINELDHQRWSQLRRSEPSWLLRRSPPLIWSTCEIGRLWPCSSPRAKSGAAALKQPVSNRDRNRDEILTLRPGWTGRRSRRAERVLRGKATGVEIVGQVGNPVLETARRLWWRAFDRVCYCIVLSRLSIHDHLPRCHLRRPDGDLR